MKKLIRTINYIGLISFISLISCKAQVTKQEILEGEPTRLESVEKGFAVIELFTSEGCSSCPPADEAVAELVKQYADKEVYVLGYHVDYWDRLGWKDPFGSEVFSQKQREYGDVFKLSSIYTPQIVVNGTTEMVGSNKSKLRESVNQALKSKENPNFNFTLQSVSVSELVLKVDAQLSNNEIINCALVQDKATTVVKRGENTGRTLNHINVVIDVQSFSSTENELKIDLSTIQEASNSHVLVLLQNSLTKEIIAVKRIELK